MKAIAYIRVSTEDQANGEEAQRQAIERHAAISGMTVVDWIIERRSGKDTRHRPLFRAVLERLAAGEAEAVVVAKLDRLSRNVADFGRILEQGQKEGWRLLACDMNLDTDSPAGEFCATMLIAAAQFERRMIGQRTKEAIRAAKANGRHIGRPLTIPWQDRAAVITLRGEGYSYEDIGRKVGLGWTSCRRIWEAFLTTNSCDSGSVTKPSMRTGMSIS